MRLVLVLSASAALLAFAAQPARAEVGWALFIDVGPESGAPCITAADVARRVEARTGAALAVLDGPLRAPAAPEIEHWIEGRAAHSGGGVTLALALRDSNGALIGERVLDRPDAACEELRDAAVLAIAVMMGKGESLHAPPPDAAASEPPPAQPRSEAALGPAGREAASEPPGPVAPATEQAPIERRVPAYRAPLHARAFAGAAVTAGVVPGVAAQATITVRAIHAVPWPIELSVSFLGESEVELIGASNGRATFEPLYGVLATCPLGAGSGSLRADACVGVLAGVSFTSASGFTRENRDSVQPLAGVVLRLPLSLRLAGPLALRASAMLGTPIVYNEVEAIDSERESRVVAESFPLFAGLDLALGVDLF